MNAREFATALNNLTPEQIAQAMEKLPTDALKWAVRFEALAATTETPEKGGAHEAEARSLPRQR